MNKIKFWISSNWGIATLFALVTFGVFFCVLVLHKTTFLTNLDNVDQFYTWYQKLATSLHSGNLPIWNANVFSGQSFAGELQPGIFYPLNLLFVWLFGSASGISQGAIDYLVAIHFMLAAFGAYLLVKEMGASKQAAFLSGLVFSFSGTLGTRAVSQTAIFFGLSLVPYPLLFLAKHHNDLKKHWRWLVFSGMALGMIILSGHVQPFFHAALLLIIFEATKLNWPKFLSVAWPTAKKMLVVFAAAFVVALPQIWLSAQYLPHTYRIQAEGYLGPKEKLDYGHFAKSFSIEPHEAANFIDPVKYPIRDGNNFFIGLFPLGIIILALVLAQQKIKDSKIWQGHNAFIKVVLIFSALSMLGYWTWFAVVLYKLPFVYQIRQTGRYVIMFHLALTLVFAACWQGLQNLKLTSQQKRYVRLTGGFLLINFVYLFLLRNHVFDTHLALQTLLVVLGLLAFVSFTKKRVRNFGVGLLILATALVNSSWFLPKIDSTTKLPSRYDIPAPLVEILEGTNGQYRVEINDDTVPVNIGNIYNIQTTWGYAATVYAPYFEFRHKAGLDPEFVKDLLGAKYEVIKKTKPEMLLVFADDQNQIYVQERTSALPKMFTTTSPGSTQRQDYQPVDVATEKYQDHYQKFEVNLTTNQQVIISEIAYPGWNLKIDGKKTNWKPYTINNIPIFRSFHLPNGTHTIEFEYHPFTF